MEYIAFDCHKHYTYAVVEDERGRVVREGRIPHERGPYGSSFPAAMRAPRWRRWATGTGSWTRSRKPDSGRGSSMPARPSSCWGW